MLSLARLSKHADDGNDDDAAPARLPAFLPACPSLASLFALLLRFPVPLLSQPVCLPVLQALNTAVCSLAAAATVKRRERKRNGSGKLCQ